MFLDFYGLREQPFGVTPNPRFLYQTPMHREALASLRYGVESDLGFAALIAEPGMGKTTLLFHLLELFRNTARTALLFQTPCTPLELMRYLLSELEVETHEQDAVRMHEAFKDFLVKEARAGRRVILIIDEAQNLDDAVLESIRLLSDFETPRKKLLHIILSGQPQLAHKLAQPHMAQLLQRIALLGRLKPLGGEEVRKYIDYRLITAGYSGGQLFAPKALDLIAEQSDGVPRKINRLCFNALSIGFALGKREIDAKVIAEVGSDLDIQFGSKTEGTNRDTLAREGISAASRSTSAPVFADTIPGSSTIIPAISAAKPGELGPALPTAVSSTAIAATYSNPAPLLKNVIETSPPTLVTAATPSVKPPSSRHMSPIPIAQPFQRSISCIAEADHSHRLMPLIASIVVPILIFLAWLAWETPSQTTPPTSTPGASVQRPSATDQAIDIPSAPVDPRAVPRPQSVGKQPSGSKRDGASPPHPSG